MGETLKGIFTPHIVPLQANGDIDEPELRRYIDWLIAKGIHGLYPNGSTGEFTRFTADERRRIVKIVCQQAAGRVPVLAGAAEADVRETIRACETYAGYGARAVAIVSPFYYKLCPESVYAYFREIALNSPMNVTLYNIPMFASPIDVPTIRRLAEFERVIGIKDSSGDMAFMMRMISAVRPVRPDFTFLTGWEAVLVPMLLIGVDGGTNATSGVVPELTRQLYDLTRAGQIDEAMRLQFRMLELFDAMLYSADFPEGFRAAVELRGFRMGQSRQPQTDRQQIDRAGLQKVLQCILADFGYVEAVPGCCPPRTGDINRDRVSHIAATVLEELHRRGRRMNESLGLLEITGLTPTLVAVDAMEKAGDIRLIQCELNDFYGVCTKIVGATEAVKTAIAAGQRAAEQMGGNPVADVIPRPDPDAMTTIVSAREHNPLIQQDVVFFPEYASTERAPPPSSDVPSPRAQKGHAMSQSSSFALGLIETQGFTAAFEAIDTACKAANVEVIGKEKLGGGYITIIVRGELSAVTAAIEAGRVKVEGLGKLIAAHVIARPSPAVLALLPKP